MDEIMIEFIEVCKNENYNLLLYYLIGIQNNNGDNKS